jgi:hypothetical protein
VPSEKVSWPDELKWVQLPLPQAAFAKGSG